MNAAQRINQTSGEVEYYTPPEIIEAARATMGGIDLDPASSEAANRTVKAARIFTKQDDGLTNPWFGRVWLNHPFGRKQNHLWIARLVYHVHRGQVSQSCCLTYACTSEAWFKPLLYLPQCYLTPRTNYLLPDGTVYKGVTKGSVVTYFGPHPHLFREHFSKLGVVKV